MKLEAVCEFNDGGCLIYAANYSGAYVRGKSKNEALAKFAGEMRSYLRWLGTSLSAADLLEIEIVQEKRSEIGRAHV